ncbi:MAG: YtxH domain-containing protein [Deltaproteobacteria bacterium]
MAAMKWNNLSNFHKDDLLDALGLAPKRGFSDYFFPAIGLFGAGLLLGTGLGMILAPQSGPELRKNLFEKAREKMPDIVDREIQAHPM